MPVRGSGKGDDIGKIFVGGLATSTSQGGLQAYFEKYGEVTDCVLMSDPVTKRSRGFGFVTFRDPQTVDTVTSSKPHVLDGKTIDPKPAVPRGPGQGTQTGGQSQRNSSNDCKVFVGGLAFGTSEDDIKEYFSSYGTVKNVQLMYDRNTEKMRGFGFVTFDSKESVDKTTAMQYHQINGKMAEVKKAEYREPRGSPHQHPQDHHMGGNPLATPVHGMPGGMGQSQYGGQYMQQGGYGQQGGMPGMGRGYGPNPAYGYGAAPGGGYGYAPHAPPAYGAGNMAMGGGQPTNTPGYSGAGYGAAPQMAGYGVSAPGRDAPAAPYGGAPSFGGSAALQPAAPLSAEYGGQGLPPTSSALPGSATAGGAQSRGDTPGGGDFTGAYSAYGLGNYQQQDSQYGPARSSFSAESNYPGYPSAESYGVSGAGAAAYSGGESFGRGGGAARGFHPYGR